MIDQFSFRNIDTVSFVLNFLVIAIESKFEYLSYNAMVGSLNPSLIRRNIFETINIKDFPIIELPVYNRCD